MAAKDIGCQYASIVNLKTSKEMITMMLESYKRANSLNKSLHLELLELRTKILDLEQNINGSEARSSIGEQNDFPTIWNYLWSASGSSNSTYGPTKTHLKSYNIANQMMKEYNSDVKNIEIAIDELIIKLNDIGAPAVNKKLSRD